MAVLWHDDLFNRTVVVLVISQWPQGTVAQWQSVRHACRLQSLETRARTLLSPAWSGTPEGPWLCHGGHVNLECVLCAHSPWGRWTGCHPVVWPWVWMPLVSDSRSGVQGSATPRCLRGFGSSLTTPSCLACNTWQQLTFLLTLAAVQALSVEGRGFNSPRYLPLNVGWGLC